MNQICTNKQQSSRLLEAGVRPETADMYLDEFERLSHLNIEGLKVKRIKIRYCPLGLYPS